jgi:hypothetical protein
LYDFAGRTALVTGASSGIGAAFARQLAGRGAAALVLVARSENRLGALADELRARHDRLRIEVIPADLGEADAPARVYEETAVRRGLRVDLLVNNAGFGSHGFFDALPAERETEMVAVNVTSLVGLTRLFLPGMAAHGNGAVLNVASTAAFQPVPFMATYGATKAFVLSFSEALWAENRGRGVRVLCLCPGATRTEFQNHTGERGLFEYFPEDTPERVAQIGLDALAVRADVSPYVVVGAANYGGTLLPRVLTRGATARVIGRLFRPSEGKKGPAAPSWLGAAGAAAFAAVAFAGYLRRRNG